MTRLDDATRAQLLAADPKASTWLSANAGSGKTRVLTDRVARLLLDGVSPQRILCLTYTKAAASEMQNRLFQRLGAWSMSEGGALRESLARLGISKLDDLDQARTLFARAIETPGGLKIQTIHSFCASLLRQFPLEAGVSPQFSEMDDRAQEMVIDDVMEELAAASPEILDDIAFFYSGETFSDVAKAVLGDAEGFMASPANVLADYGLSNRTTSADILKSFPDPRKNTWWPGLLKAMDRASKGLSNDAAQFGSIDFADISEADWAFLEKTCLYKTKDRINQAKIGGYPQARHKNVIAALGDDLHHLESLMRDVEATKDQLLLLENAKRTNALRAFARAFIPKYETRKAELGVLDFDDLILRARRLLTNVDMTWILFRLDGGIDHILVDEAQDTSPAQWSVVEALASEMTAGEGARADVKRTLFVVGDLKQSIYSFQGADAQGYQRVRDAFTNTLGDDLAVRSLNHSFRSSPAILSVVDKTFDGTQWSGLGEDVSHLAFRADLPGRVDLWDLEEPVNAPDDPDWFNPVDRPQSHSPRVRLAKKVASFVSDLMKTGTITDENVETRPVHGGDILILVRRRSDLFDAIIRACKAENLPIAGADRLRINAELAVRDVLALLSFVALPEDDLSLAASLRSPLFGWSESDLYGLAQGRGEKVHLWQALRRRKEEYPETHARLTALRDRADFLRPYELIEMILTEQGGRRRFYERLGHEAEDGLNEILNQAIEYEQRNVPSLTGFLMHATAEEIQVKRQLDTEGRLIRVMTVHGAKGLEAPIVILPDTIQPVKSRRKLVLKTPQLGPVWASGKEDSAALMREAQNAADLAAEEEDSRLLYVAMTRAAQWLVVAGAKGRADPSKSWWASIQTGMIKAGAKRIMQNEDCILRLEHGFWCETPGGGSDDRQLNEEAIETDQDQVVPPEPKRQAVIAPSKLEGAKVLPGETNGITTSEALDRGTSIHLLLDTLPNVPRDRWNEMVRHLLGSNDEFASDLLSEVASIVDTLPELFATEALSEVPFAAPLPQADRRIEGVFDRLTISDQTVRIVDFKTNSRVPDQPEETPEGLLRQMGAYLVAAEQIWPEHEISVEIVWTRTASRMVYPHAIVRKAFNDTLHLDLVEAHT